jgi:glycosyltransferase involved in cell wall biosynthesis
MRVGIIGPMWPDSFASNIADTVRGMGHQAIELGSAYSLGGPYTSRVAASVRSAFPRLDEHAQSRIARAALDQDCEIVINVDQRLMPSAVSQLRRNGAKVALWFPDALLNMGRQLMLLASYDAIFFKEPHLVDRLQAMLDLPLFYLPQACHSRWHRPFVPAGTDPYLVIAGNMYPSRIRLLERLLAKGIPLKLYGPGFPRWVGPTPLRQAHVGRCVFREEKAQTFRAAAAVLNTMHPAEIYGVNSRLFEAAGCGAAVLTEFRPGVAELFTVGDEVMPFNDFDELVSQATRLLSESGLTQQVGDAAARRAHKDHTYERRLTTILEILT